MENSGPASAVTVSQLNRQVKTLLESGLDRLWVEGEVSNVARPASGHVYFSLKDDAAQIRAAWFRQRQRGPTLALKNGDHVLAYGKVSLYEARGDYQLIVEQVEPAGEGVLMRRFEALKKKLAAEGLFDEERKRPLPVLPGRIGVVTSPSGAAIRDIITVLRRRFPAVPVIIYPAAVQGDSAPAELIAALATAARRAECDVLILGRGGGSLEDLWAFNDEALARAIVASPIPVVSGVGHEVDFTIADFVADLRAPTPSGAAEIVVPDASEWLRAAETLGRRIARYGRRMLEDRAQTLDWLARRLAAGSPARRLAAQRDRLRELRGRSISAMRTGIYTRIRALHALQSGILRQSPALRVQRSLSRAAQLRQRLTAAGHDAIAGAAHRLQLAERGLAAVSPRSVLERGYAIVTDAGTGQALRDARTVKPGGTVHARLARGMLIATVDETKDDDVPHDS